LHRDRLSAMMLFMNSRERFFTALQHRTPDRPPLDIGATTLTSMSRNCQAALCGFLGLKGDPQPTNSGVDERILRWAGTDFRAVGGIPDLPSPFKRLISPTANVNCWGIRSELVDGQWQFTHSPLRGATVDDLSSFPWPEPRLDEQLLARWEAQAKDLRRDGRYAVIGEHPVFGVLELGCWMCGYDDFLMRLAGDHDFVREFFGRVLEIQMAVIEQYYSALGPYIDVTTCGDDFGMQTGPLISPHAFRTLVAPYFSARIKRTKELSNCLFFHHSCGSVFDLLDAIIECGVDIINPVQTSARDMQPERLKAAFGDRLAFWGAVDVQAFLPSATPEEVRRGVRSLVDVLGRDGGYVMAPGHNMQDDVPPANIAAWVEEFHRESL